MDVVNKNLSLGIDLGGSSAKLALINAQKCLATVKSEGYTNPDLAELSRCVVAGIEKLEANAGRSLIEVTAIGLCVPGPVDEAGNIIQCVNLPCIDGLNGRDWLHTITGRHVKTYISTDQHAAAYGEYHTNPSQDRTLYLALGTGVGGALFDQGKPINLTRQTPGHLGHIDVSGGDPNAPHAPAGGRGSLEAYLGLNALRMAGLPLDDPEACAKHPAIDRPLRALAQAIRIAFAIYRMNRVVLLGGISIVIAPALPRLIQLVADDLTPVAPKNWTLELGTLGPTAAAQGIAILAQNVALNDPQGKISNSSA